MLSKLFLLFITLAVSLPSFATVVLSINTEFFWDSKLPHDEHNRRDLVAWHLKNDTKGKETAKQAIIDEVINHHLNGKSVREIEKLVKRGKSSINRDIAAYRAVPKPSVYT